VSGTSEEIRFWKSGMEMMAGKQAVVSVPDLFTVFTSFSSLKPMRARLR
jgi:hypothetical protein